MGEWFQWEGLLGRDWLNISVNVNWQIWFTVNNLLESVSDISWYNSAKLDVWREYSLMCDMVQWYEYLSLKKKKKEVIFCWKFCCSCKEKFDQLVYFKK